MSLLYHIIVLINLDRLRWKFQIWWDCKIKEKGTVTNKQFYSANQCFSCTTVTIDKNKTN